METRACMLVHEYMHVPMLLRSYFVSPDPSQLRSSAVQWLPERLDAFKVLDTSDGVLGAILMRACTLHHSIYEAMKELQDDNIECRQALEKLMREQRQSKASLAEVHERQNSANQEFSDLIKSSEMQVELLQAQLNQVEYRATSLAEELREHRSRTQKDKLAHMQQGGWQEDTTGGGSDQVGDGGGDQGAESRVRAQQGGSGSRRGSLSSTSRRGSLRLVRSMSDVGFDGGGTSKRTATATSVSALILKLLQYNETTLEEGFDDFDADADGCISLSDLFQTAQVLNLLENVLPEELIDWHKLADASGSGLLNRQEWEASLKGADPNIFEFCNSPSERGEEEETGHGNGESEVKSEGERGV